MQQHSRGPSPLHTPDVSTPRVQRANAARRPLQAVALTPLSRAEQLQGRIAELVAENSMILGEVVRLSAELVAEVRLAEARVEAASDQHMPDLLSVREIARRVSLSERQVLNMLEDGT